MAWMPMVALPEHWHLRRLELRPPRIDDAEAIFAGWAADAEVTRYLTWRPSRHVDETRQFLQLCLDDWRGSVRRVWVITQLEHSKPIGMIDIRLQGQRANLGYVLARHAWGRGYMTEAVQNLTQTTLHEAGVVRVDAVCDVDNVASARVLEKSGLLREGLLRKYLLHPNVSNEPRDVYIYARTRPVNAGMLAADVRIAMDALTHRNLQAWIAGGWGIDALLGTQTRQHADLDLAFRADQEPGVLAALREQGYRLVLDHRPGRIVVADDDGHEIDLHPVAFDANGDGIQTGIRGEVFHYSREGFAHGSIGGQSVPCLSVAQQLRFHSGYDLREFERQDLEKLGAATASTEGD
jgi:[ribosomal protein S5]-alanine N-acetyltransferase